MTDNSETAWHATKSEWEKIGLQPGAFTAFKAGYAANHAEIERLRTALEQIARCEGKFSRDPLKHAENVIENAQTIALTALNTETK